MRGDNFLSLIEINRTETVVNRNLGCQENRYAHISYMADAKKVVLWSNNNNGYFPLTFVSLN